MNGKMKAVVLTAPNQYGIEWIEIPKPMTGEVLVKIMSVAICGSDPPLLSGKSYQNLTLPFTLGHEFSGEVVELGDGVLDYNVGDRVAGEAHCGCGYCRNCKKGLYNLCLNFGNNEKGHRHYGFSTNGCYAQYNAYNIKTLAKIPDNLSFDEAALCDPAGTAYNAVMLAGVTPGGYSLIIGAGPIGIFVMQLANAMGSTTIVLETGSRGVKAKSLGGDYIIDFEKTDDIPSVVRSIASGLGADEVFECSGVPSCIAQAVQCVKRGGHIALIGQSSVTETMIPHMKVILDQIHIHGVRANPNSVESVLSLFSSGKINAKDVITHCFPIGDVKQAIGTFVNKTDGAMKVIIRPWD